MELTPNNRVLSGEVIIFQNEMLDIFKDIINHTDYPLENSKPLTSPLPHPLKPRYVFSLILEFLRSLLENSIP